MKISVVTVCYNAVNTIESTIKSVISQTLFGCVEYLIIDGASTDGTLDIIDLYKDKISKIVSGQDYGIYNAMNNALNIASGDFVIFMNAGDTFYSDDVIEKILVAIENNGDAKFIFGNANFVNPSKGNVFTDYGKIKRLADYLANSNICHQSIFYSKELFEEFGQFDEGLNLFADWDFNVKVLLENSVEALFVDIPICNYVLGGFSMQKENAKKVEFEKKFIRKKYKNIYKNEKILRFFKKFANKFIKKSFKNKYLLKIIDICNPKLDNIKKYSDV